MTVENTPDTGTPADPPAGENTPPEAGANPPAATPPAAEPPQTSEITFPSQDKFNERMDRNFRSRMKKEFGVEDPSQLQEMMEQHKILKEAQEAREREAMSEQERIQADLNAANERAAALEEERDQIRFESHINGVCAELGITNIDYAMYEIARAADGVEEGSQIDAKEHLASLLEADSSRAALGLSPKAQTVTTPANTSPTDGNNAPPDPNAGAVGQKSVSDMTPQEFQQHLASKGVGLTG